MPFPLARATLSFFSLFPPTPLAPSRPAKDTRTHLESLAHLASLSTFTSSEQRTPTRASLPILHGLVDHTRPFFKGSFILTPPPLHTVINTLFLPTKNAAMGDALQVNDTSMQALASYLQKTLEPSTRHEGIMHSHATGHECSSCKHLKSRFVCHQK